MAYTVKVRGASEVDPDATIELEYLCPVHGRFEATVLRSESPDAVACPIVDIVTGECGERSPWSPSSAPAVHTQFVVSVSRGRNDPKPHKDALDLMPLGEGQSFKEWKAGRKKIHRDYRHRKLKEYLSS